MEFAVRAEGSDERGKLFVITGLQRAQLFIGPRDASVETHRYTHTDAHNCDVSGHF